MDWTDTLRLRESGTVDEFVNPNQAGDVEQLEDDGTAYDTGPTHAPVAAVDAPQTKGTKKAAPAKKAAKKPAGSFTRKRA